ncbi:MAG: cell division protein FtsQ/DivIB [Gammaproteobacteria bacterium]|nr:cell division protein FtsQ/DivIB [Gammaproteobacteria bacterium]
MFRKNKNKKHVSAVKKNTQSEKSLRGIIIAKAFLLLLVVAAGYAVTQWYSTAHLFTVKQVRIEGEFNYISKSQIKERISGHSVGGFFDLDIVALRNELVQMQWVGDAYIRREWPDSVVIRVVEKKPVAKWNASGVLTANGDLFYPDGSAKKLELVQLNGPQGRHGYVLSEFNKMQSLLHLAEIKVSRLSQNERRSWQMTIGDMTIHLGRKNIYKKIENLAAVYTKLIKPEADAIRQIDFRYTNGFAVNWKNKDVTSKKFEYLRVTEMNQFKTGSVFLVGATNNV